MANLPDALTIEEHQFPDDGLVPNNPSLPRIVCRGVLKPAVVCEALFADNGESAAWRNGVYAHHPCYNTAHQVLGITGESVRVRLGSDADKPVELGAGDVVVIPAGVAYESEGAIPDLMAISGLLNHSGGESRSCQVSDCSQPPSPFGDRVSEHAGHANARARRVDRQANRISVLRHGIDYSQATFSMAIQNTKSSPTGALAKSG
jgi:uncharacterized protein YjlB